MGDTRGDVGLLGPGLLSRGAQQARLAFPRLRPWQVALSFAVVTWIPSAVLAAIYGQFAGHGWVLSRDVAMYVRLLLVGPVLVSAGPLVDKQMASLLTGWAEAEVIPADRRGAFEHFMSRLYALRRSYWPEVGVLVLAYALTALAYGARASQGDQPWLFPRSGNGLFSPAGWWNVAVSGPLFLHACLWWMWRFCVWTAILIRLLTLPARVLGTHPDGVGGLDPLARTHNLLLWLPAGLSAVAASGLANAILHRGASLATLRPTAISFVVIQSVLFLAPLLIFTPALLAARRRMSARYGAVAARHAAHLEHELDDALAADPRTSKRLGDDLLESEANLAQSFAGVLTTRASLLNRSNLLLFAAAAVGPLLPLELMEIPARELLSRLKDMLM